MKVCTCPTKPDTFPQNRPTKPDTPKREINPLSHGQIPATVTKDPNVTDPAYRAYGILATNERNGIVNCGGRFMSKEVGQNKDTFFKGIRDLIELGHIERVAGSGRNGLRSAYRLLSPVFSKRKQLTDEEAIESAPKHKVALSKCKECLKMRVLRPTGWCRKCEEKKDTDRRTLGIIRREVPKILAG